MGGIAFSLKDPRALNTPRMPPNVYRHVRDQCHAALRQRFLVVASPIEAPAKLDYGDVDVFATWDTRDTPLGNFEHVSKLLGTTYTRVEELVYCEAQFAVPWPEGLDEPDYVPADKRLRYCQIDLHICKSIEEFHWNLWYYAHGDLTPMIHNMLRPFDLTINHRGLFLRIPTIKNGVRKVFVTNEPSQALRLLGYDPMADAWQSEFQDLGELFQHTTECRLFRGFYGTELTGEDGRIMAVRDTFKTWIADFVPKCTGYYSGTNLSKTELRDEILVMFPETKADYDLEFLNVERRKQRNLFSRIIKPSIPVREEIGHEWRTIAAASLRDIIMDTDYSLGFAPTRSLRLSNGIYDEEEVSIFVEEAWKLVGDEAWERQYGLKGMYSHHLAERLVTEAEFERMEDVGEASEFEEDEDQIRFPPKPEGYRQTWYESDMNDL